MRGLPQELLIAFIFGAVMLVQLVFRLWRRRAAARQRPLEPESQRVPAPLPVPSTGARATLEAATVTPSRAPSSMAAGLMLQPARRPRRFSRQALMPDRRAVRDAVVIAAILRPCHAHLPHGDV
ncbi:hypothetical protein [uncultured Piscinibacter sp.]|uniref:hypothetical protein n=1 Tax=uncultured Piscinibacter sp. TaxID=1131835 RepID=UPI0026394B4D|nr:hypothetical protein [uncultured Piscinibacter sp.]